MKKLVYHENPTVGKHEKGQGFILSQKTWSSEPGFLRQNKIDPPTCDELSRVAATHKYSIFNFQLRLVRLGL